MAKRNKQLKAAHGFAVSLLDKQQLFPRLTAPVGRFHLFDGKEE
jgi:hypothetical protein